MSISLFIAFAAICLVVDFATRKLLERWRERSRRKEREQALAVSLNLEFTREAKSLRRVEVKDPVARILCVDDESIVLDSFRKILVLDGYCVDSVETGQEALGLIQSNHYDFVFTDLRMPAMSGVDVVKSVKHLRPDIDIIIITGFATIETAVECMKFGAMDYVQKPFTDEELSAFVKKAVIKRNDQLEKKLRPKIKITHGAEAEYCRAGEFSIPGGVLISQGHCWASVSQDGVVKVGLDDFAKKLIGRVDALELPPPDTTCSAGQALFAVRQRNRRIGFLAPVSGRITKVNVGLGKTTDALDTTPYHNHWVCTISGDRLDAELPSLKIGKAAVTLFEQDIDRFTRFINDAKPELTRNSSDSGLFAGALEALSDHQWDQAARQFFTRVN